MAAAPRRAFLLGALALPAAFAGARLISTAADGVRAARPRAAGTTTSRCASCGGNDHTMLDPRCPSAPEVV
jgi:hypothetical protein